MLPNAASNASVVCISLGCAHMAGRKTKSVASMSFSRDARRNLNQLSQKLRMQLLAQSIVMNRNATSTANEVL